MLNPCKKCGSPVPNDMDSAFCSSQCREGSYDGVSPRKTFTVIQAGSVFQVEADKPEFYPDRVYLMREDVVVFAGPSAFTTLIDNDALKEKPDV